MQRTLVKETVEKVGEKVLLQGWVNIVRDHGKITFLDLRDRTGLIQCIGQNIPKLLPQYVVSIEGKVVERPPKLVNEKLETGKVEIQIEKLEILTNAEELPFDMGKEDLDVQLPTLLDNRTLTLRHPKVQKIFKVQEAVMEGFRRAAQKLDFTEIFVPTISASSTEGGTEVFKVKYYDNDAFMVQSPQLYKQMLVPAFERVYLVSHIYRAEPSVTTRHLAESIQMDCEMGFVNFEELMDSLESIAKDTLKHVSESCSKILSEYNIPELKVSAKVPRLTMREAQKIILERTGVDHTSELDLMPEDEREISKWALEEHDSDLVTVTHYPTKKRAFYTKPDPDNPEFSLSYDLIFRGVEILSGSQRINDYEELKDVIKERGMDPKNFEMYLQAFKYGMPSEGGFSFGLERMTMLILNLKNVREASLFPRDMERVDFLFSAMEEDGKKKSNKKDVYSAIIELLDSKEIKYRKYEHEPVFTSKQAAEVRGTNIHQGAKALVLQADKNFILFVSPADIDADLAKLREKLEVKKLRMASKESVKVKTGVEVGAVPPLGSLVGLKTYVDSRMAENQEVAFNAGRHDRSIKMKYEDFLKVEKPQIVE